MIFSSQLSAVQVKATNSVLAFDLDLVQYGTSVTDEVPLEVIRQCSNASLSSHRATVPSGFGFRRSAASTSVGQEETYRFASAVRSLQLCTFSLT
jgi:hypothetical protein